MWHAIADGFPGGIGSEGGIVRMDDEDPRGARITLEEGGSVAPWSVTCGIYGWMVHTRFFAQEREAMEQVGLMKLGLERILGMLSADCADEQTLKAEVVDAIEAFVRDFP